MKVRTGSLYRSSPGSLPLVALLLFFLSSCYKGRQTETEVYHNEFETKDLGRIDNPHVFTYNNSTVLGRYNSEGFILKLEDLPQHDLVKISFDLFIHDSWDGNENTLYGPDIWQMKADGDLYINTTFSNCYTGFCVPQSYPLNYLNNKYAPKNGAYRTDLPGVCFYAGVQGGTTLYKIEKTIRHTGRAIDIQCLDSLVQNGGDRLCDESWSIDNISVKVVKLD